MAEKEDVGQLTSETASKHDEEVDRLSTKLAAEKDKRREDWFLFVLVGIILFNVHVFSTFEGWGSPIALVLLQLVFLIFAAERLGVEAVSVWATYLIDNFGRTKVNKNDEE